MFVKVVARDKGQSIYEVPSRGDLQYGVQWFDTRLGDPREALIERLDLSGPQYMIRNIDVDSDHAPQTINDGGDNPLPAWPIRYAHWFDLEAAGLQIIMTVGDMYILSDSGSTVDRVT